MIPSVLAGQIQRSAGRGDRLQDRREQDGEVMGNRRYTNAIIYSYSI